MSKQNQAVAPAQSAFPAIPAVALFNGSPVEPAFVETIEQLGREFQVIFDGQKALDRSQAKCDVALYDIVNGLSYDDFITVRTYFVNGCRDKGSPTDEAAGQVWVRAISRIVTSCGFVRPKSKDKDAERMAKKRAEQIAKFEAKSDGELLEQKAELLAKGDSKSIAQAQTIAKELDRREKPAIDAAQSQRVAVRDKLIARAKDLCKAATADADEKLIAALQALA